MTCNTSLFGNAPVDPMKPFFKCFFCGCYTSINDYANTQFYHDFARPASEDTDRGICEGCCQEKGL